MNNVVDLDEHRQKLLADANAKGDEQPTLPLYGGGGGGTSGGMDAVEAKIAAAEARTDTKFAKLDGKIDRLIENMTDARSEARATRRTVIGTGLSLAALMAALLAVFTNGFSVGSKVADVSRATAIETFNQMAVQTTLPQNSAASTMTNSVVPKTK